MSWYNEETGETTSIFSHWSEDDDNLRVKKQRAQTAMDDFDALEDEPVPGEAAKLLKQADELDDGAQHNEELAGVARTDQARKRLLWEANQKRGAAVNRWREAQAILHPTLPVFVQVGGVTVDADDTDYTGYEIPDRIRVLLGPELEGYV